MAKTPEEFACEEQQELDTLRARYKQAMQTLLEQANDKGDMFQSRFREFHSAGVAFFNACERSIVSGSSSGADRDPTWYTDKGEMAANTLETMLKHFRVVKNKAAQAGRVASDFKPSLTAYATMQRIAKHVVPSEADKLRADFLSLGLPTYGFDHDEKEKRRMPTWQKVTGVCFGITFVVVLLILAVFIPKPSTFQVFVFRTVLALAAGACAAMLTGFLNIEGRFKALSIRAGAGLAVLIFIYTVNPPALVERSRSNPDESSTSNVIDGERSGDEGARTAETP